MMGCTLITFIRKPEKTEWVLDSAELQKSCGNPLQKFNIVYRMFKAQWPLEAGEKCANLRI